MLGADHVAQGGFQLLIGIEVEGVDRGVGGGAHLLVEKVAPADLLVVGQIRATA